MTVRTASAMSPSDSDSSPPDERSPRAGEVDSGRHASRSSARRSFLLVAAIAVVAAWLTWLLLPTMHVATDLHTYERAGRDLYGAGNPYRSNAGTFFEWHYRYPPLLAMLMPIAGPIWFVLTSGAWSFVLWLRWRSAGPIGLLLPLLLIGAWGQQALNGNAWAFVVAALAAVPWYPRAGAVGLAVVSWIKLYPALGVLWYLGRREWRSLWWFSVTFVVLGLIQLPWIDEFIGYSFSRSASFPAQYSLRALGPVIWVGGTVLLAATTVIRARSERGWLLALITMLAALPRVNPIYLILLLAYAPPREGSRPQDDVAGSAPTDARRARRPGDRRAD